MRGSRPGSFVLSDLIPQRSPVPPLAVAGPPTAVAGPPRAVAGPPTAVAGPHSGRRSPTTVAGAPSGRRSPSAVGTRVGHPPGGRTPLRSALISPSTLLLSISLLYSSPSSSSLLFYFWVLTPYMSPISGEVSICRFCQRNVRKILLA